MNMLWSNLTRQGRRGVPKAAMVWTAGFLFVSSLPPARLYGQSVNFGGMQSTVPMNGLTGPLGVAVDAAGDLFVTDNSDFVFKVPAGGGTQTTLANLNTPEGIAVDKLGNVFIVASSSTPPLIMEIPVNSSTPVIVPTTGLGGPEGIAVDAAGNLFIADSGNHNVVEVLAGSGSQITVASNLGGSMAVTVDQAGNLFVADVLGNRILEIPPGGGAAVPVISGLHSPSGVAVDTAGDLFVADSASNSVLEYPAGGGAPLSLGSGFNQPTGIALDQSGNIFVTDSNNYRVVEIQRPSVNFGTVNLCPAGHATPAPCSQTLTLNYNVTAGDSLGPVKVVTGGAQNKDFTLANGSTCIGAVTTGTQCTVNVNFTPSTAGPRHGAVQLTDSSGNLLSTTLIYGLAVGPQMAFGSAAQAVLDNDVSGSFGVAVDGSGNAFVADAANGRVVEIPAGGGSPITVASGFSYPLGVAVTGAGDIIVTDDGTGLVLELPASGGSPITLASTISGPAGVAVDGAGNLFIASYNTQSVVQLRVSGGAPTQVAAGLLNPIGVALDGAGNLFIADSGNNRVVKVPVGGGILTTVANGLSNPTGVAVDVAGDVFIADQNNGRLVEVPAGGGTQITVGSFPYEPSGVALDATGNLFVLTLGDDKLQEIPYLSQPPALNFAATSVGSTSSDSPQSFMIQNLGNAPLSATGVSVSSNFAQVAGPGTPADCTANFSVEPGGSCNISISFTPLVSGSIQGSVTLADNALNGAPATQSIPLAGLAQLVFQTITFNPVPPQTVGASVTLIATASSMLPVTFAAQSTACTVSNTTATMIAPGTCFIVVTQAGNQQYAPISVGESFIVNSVASFTITPQPASETITRGVLAGFLLQLKSVNGFNGSVKLSCSGGPAGAICANLPQTVKVNGTAYALSGILFPAKTKAGTYTMTFTGISGSVTATTTAKFIVK